MQSAPSLLRHHRELIIFEAAARLGSFTKAAASLSMQQPSVSASIQQFEASLGLKLFIRTHRQITLTAAGQDLFFAISGPLSEIGQALDDMRHSQAQDYVTISASSAFSFHWMMPRLPDLKAKYPHVELRMQNSDREPDLQVENISLAIRLGGGDWPGHEAYKIAEEVIFPVARPEVMARLPENARPEDLLSQDLIHLEEPICKRPSWAQWFRHHGVTQDVPQTGLRLNDYALVLQAAISGEGIAFGWQHQTRLLIKQGMLAARQDWGWRTGNAIYLVWPKRRKLSAHALDVIEWFRENTANKAPS